MILIANSIHRPTDSVARLPKDWQSPALEVNVLFNPAKDFVKRSKRFSKGPLVRGITPLAPFVAEIRQLHAVVNTSSCRD
jgi:hypothetical protein